MHDHAYFFFPGPGRFGVGGGVFFALKPKNEMTVSDVTAPVRLWLALR
jgi:hypothetical protein